MKTMNYLASFSFFLFLLKLHGFNCVSEELHYSHITTCTQRECEARSSPAINNLFSLLQEASSKREWEKKKSKTNRADTLKLSSLLPAFSHKHCSQSHTFCLCHYICHFLLLHQHLSTLRPPRSVF